MLLSIDFRINNSTALSFGLLDDILTCTLYSNPCLYPCEMNYLKVYIYR
jgi:hypothetical protein